MATNKRIFYATQGVKLYPVSEAGTVGNAIVPGGLQSAGVTTNFNLEKVFQLGQLELYDSIENNPEVEVTLNKVFDGTKPLFLITMGGASNATSGSIIKDQNNRVNMDLLIHKDTNQGTASTTGVSKLTCTGLYPSNFSYTFPTDGNATEEVTLVGTNKTWSLSPSSAAVISSDQTSKGTARRWKFDKTASVFPVGDGGMPSGSPLTNVTVSFDLGREAIYTLGEYEPYLRFVNFPVEISTEITSIGMDGDFLNMNENLYSCTGVSSVKDFPIKLVVCGSGVGDKLSINLGNKNKLQTVNYSGGDTGGGNVEISYSFTTDNTFEMVASGTFALPDGSSLSVPAAAPVPYVFGNNDK
jgi:hypothetical protein